MSLARKLVIPLSLFLLAGRIFAQDGFGFGALDAGEGEDPGGFFEQAIDGASVHGEAAAKVQLYGDDLESGGAFKDISLGNMFQGALRFSASTSNADGAINLNLRPNLEDPAKSFLIDEAYVKAYFGGFSVLGGFKKVTWGKADSLGPLDVVNPLDYSDLSEMTNLQNIKIARPLIQASYAIGGFTTLEGIFVPWFEGHRFAMGDNRWTPRQYEELPKLMERSVLGMFPASMAESLPAWEMPEVKAPDTKTLEYSQGGMRLTTTVGPADFGVQYYSGLLNRPAAGMNSKGVEALQSAIAALAAKQGAALAQGQKAGSARTDFQEAESAFQNAQQAYTSAQAEAIAAMAAYTALLSNPAENADKLPGALEAMGEKSGALALAGSALQATGKDYEDSGAELQTAALAFETAQAEAEEAGEAVRSASDPERLYTIRYNRFHQLGVDYAQVLWGFNVRGEFAGIITDDFSGDDGLVYNPSLAWSAGFDRELPGKVNLNLQINETIRLLHDQLGRDPLYETEAETDPTATRLTLNLSRKFFQDKLELKAILIWGMEDMDVYFLPGAVWTAGDLSLELTGGIFGGKDDRGELSQYRDNGFFRTLLTYSF